MASTKNKNNYVGVFFKAYIWGLNVKIMKILKITSRIQHYKKPHFPLLTFFEEFFMTSEKHLKLLIRHSKWQKIIWESCSDTQMPTLVQEKDTLSIFTNFMCHSFHVTPTNYSVSTLNHWSILMWGGGGFKYKLCLYIQGYIYTPFLLISMLRLQLLVLQTII